METKNNRQWIIVLVAALAGLLLGVVCGALGGGTIGYMLGRGAGVRQVATTGSESWEMPACRGLGENCPHEQGLQQEPGQVLPRLQTVTPGVAGARVLEVVPGTPAERAGLRVGDIIVSVSGQPVRPQQPLADLIGAHRPGDRVELMVLRGQERISLSVQLAESPTNPERGYLGVRATDLLDVNEFVP